MGTYEEGQVHIEDQDSDFPSRLNPESCEDKVDFQQRGYASEVGSSTTLNYREDFYNSKSCDVRINICYSTHSLHCNKRTVFSIREYMLINSI